MTIRWSSPERVPPLDASHVHVWKASAAELAIYSEQFLALLDASERDRHARFHFERDASRFAVSHGLLRVLLAEYGDVSPATLEFSAGPTGKPYLAPSPSSVSFNMSHSGDVILVAVARDGNVGVDVEQWSDRLNLEEMDRIAELAFSTRERNAMRALPVEQRAEAFYALWSRKEAYIKSTGIGISQGLDHFDVSCAPREAQLIADRRAAGNTYTWKLVDLELGPGYSGALSIDRLNLDLQALFAAPRVVARWLARW